MKSDALTYDDLLVLGSALGRELAHVTEILTALEGMRLRGIPTADLSYWHKRREEVTGLMAKIDRLAVAAVRSRP